MATYDDNYPKTFAKMVDAVIHRMGGVETLAAWALENQTEFYTKVAVKRLPRVVTGPDDGPISVTLAEVAAQVEQIRQRRLQAAEQASVGGSGEDGPTTPVEGPGSAT